jgi:hypothetical protein
VRWRTTRETVEEPDGTMHRPDCEKVREAVEEHSAGALLERQVAPRECWHCEPRVELVLTV